MTFRNIVLVTFVGFLSSCAENTENSSLPDNTIESSGLVEQSENSQVSNTTVKEQQAYDKFLANEKPSELGNLTISSKEKDKKDRGLENQALTQLIIEKGGDEAFRQFVLTADDGSISDAFASIGMAHLADDDRKIKKLRKQFKQPSEKEKIILDKIDKFIENQGGVQKYLEKLQKGQGDKLLEDMKKDGLTPEMLQELGRSAEEDTGKSREIQTRAVQDCQYLFTVSDRGNWPRNGLPSDLEHQLNIDSQGRPKSATQRFGRFGLSTGKSVDRRCAARVKAWGGLNSSDNAGHIMGKRFEGWNRRANLVPQNARLNTVPWNFYVEAGIDRCVEDFNWDGEFQISVSYTEPLSSPFGARPTRFFVNFKADRDFNFFHNGPTEFEFKFDVANRYPTTNDVNLMLGLFTSLAAVCR